MLPTVLCPINVPFIIDIKADRQQTVGVSEGRGEVSPGVRDCSQETVGSCRALYSFFYIFFTL